jgi:hypothetical protein
MRCCTGPNKRNWWILLLLIVALNSPTRHALSLSACYMNIIGEWSGSVLNGQGIEDMNTNFSMGGDGSWWGDITSKTWILLTAR